MTDRLSIKRDLQTFPTSGYERYLTVLEEQPLKAFAEGNLYPEAYRFAFIPSLDPPQLLTIWQDSHSADYCASYKLGHSKNHQNEGGIEHQARWQPTDEEWSELQTALDRNFWDSRDWKPEVKKDGSLWVFEGYNRGKYKRLVSWDGRNPLACSLGRTFRELIPAYLGDELLCFRSLVGDELGAIIYEYIESGRYIKALKIAQSHRSDYIKILAIESSRIYESWAELSLEAKLTLLVQGVNTALSMENLQSQAPILRDLAMKYAALGQLNRAWQVARKIGVPYYRILVLDRLYDRYQTAQRPEEATKIRTELLLSAQKIKGDPKIQQVTPIVLRHTREETFNSKLGRVLKSWLDRSE